MLEQTKEALKEFVEDDEIFDLLAKGLKKCHGSLVKAGFTEEQATLIVASQGMGISS